jgi:hypothetical protein
MHLAKNLPKQMSLTQLMKYASEYGVAILRDGAPHTFQAHCKSHKALVDFMRFLKTAEIRILTKFEKHFGTDMYFFKFYYSVA